MDVETGLRVDGEDVEQIAEALVYLLEKADEAKRMGRDARRRVLSNFTHQRRVGQLRELALIKR